MQYCVDCINIRFDAKAGNLEIFETTARCAKDDTTRINAISGNGQEADVNFRQFCSVIRKQEGNLFCPWFKQDPLGTNAPGRLVVATLTGGKAPVDAEKQP